MTGKKKQSSYRKVRKGKGFGGSRRREKSSEKTPAKESDATELIDRPSGLFDQSDVSDESSADKSDKPLSSSRKKMKLHLSTDESSGSSDEETKIEVDSSGYRLIDLKNLSSMLSSVHKCEEGKPSQYYKYMTIRKLETQHFINKNDAWKRGL